MEEVARFFDASHVGLLAVRGADRHSVLHNFCTNDIKGPDAGDYCEAFIPDVTGHVLGHVFVVVEPEALWLHTVGSPVADLCEHLSRYVITEDVTLEDVSASCCRWLICSESPEAAGVCAEAMCRGNETAVAVRTLEWFAESTRLVIAADGLTEELVLAAVAAGAEAGTSDELEGLRIASLLPIHGRDISIENLAQEVDRTGRAISFTKGCYLGQETIARIDSRGHVNRLLRGLHFDGNQLPATGSPVRDSSSGEEVGRVSSVVPVNDRGAQVQALSLLKRNAAAAGTEVFVETAEGEVSAAVVSTGAPGHGC